MKLNKVLIVLFVGLFCMPAISLERRVSYDNGRWAEIRVVADKIKTDIKDAQTIDPSETRRKIWKAYIDNMPTPEVDWYGYNYMPETYGEIFIPNIVGLIGVGLWVFLVLLNLVRKRNKHTRNAKQKEKKMKKKQIPENPIDRFFYKIGRSAKNARTAIKESEVVGKTVGFLFRNPWGLIIALFLMVLAVCGVFALLGFE